LAAILNVPVCDVPAVKFLLSFFGVTVTVPALSPALIFVPYATSNWDVTSFPFNVTLMLDAAGFLAVPSYV